MALPRSIILFPEGGMADPGDQQPTSKAELWKVIKETGGREAKGGLGGNAVCPPNEPGIVSQPTQLVVLQSP